MSLSDKLDEIRKKPEHIRRQYVYGAVVISMIFILVIWLFSLKQSLRSFSGENETYRDIKTQFENIKMDDLPSLNDNLPQQPAPATLEGVVPTN